MAKKNFFKSLIMVDEPEVKQPETIVEPVVEQKVTSVSNSFSSISTQSQPTMDNDLLAKLQSEIDSSNLPGADYLEVKTAADAMAGTIADEGVRFIAAFVSLQASDKNLTKEVVLKSIEHYKSVVLSVRQQFLTQLEKLRQSEIFSKEEEAKSIDEEIVKLTQRIQELSVNKTNILSNIVESKTECDMLERNAEFTINTVLNNLIADSEKLNICLK